jgi:hypothetical protein
MIKGRRPPSDFKGFSLRLIPFLFFTLLLSQVLGLIVSFAQADLIACGTLLIVWAWPLAWAMAGVTVLASIAASLSLDGFVIVYLWLILLVFAGRQVGRLFDMTFWPIQPFGVLAVLIAGNLVMAAANWMYYGSWVGMSLGAMLATALLAPLHWYVVRIFLLPRQR